MTIATNPKEFKELLTELNNYEYSMITALNELATQASDTHLKDSLDNKLTNATIEKTGESLEDFHENNLGDFENLIELAASLPNGFKTLLAIRQDVKQSLANNPEFSTITVDDKD